MPINRPGSSLQRWRQVQAVLLRYGFESLLDKDAIKEARRWLREELHLPLAQIEGRSQPERVRLMLEELGPAHVKPGQVDIWRTGRHMEKLILALTTTKVGERLLGKPHSDPHSRVVTARRSSARMSTVKIQPVESNKSQISQKEREER
jgi:hypothetical protein